MTTPSGIGGGKESVKFSGIHRQAGTGSSAVIGIQQGGP